MSIFSAIGGWFKKQEAAVEKLFQRIEPLAEKAEPIVKEISAVVSVVSAAEGNAGVLGAVSGYLTKAVGIDSVVETFIKANENAPVNSLLHNAATLALQYTHGQASTVISDLDTAVQVAYSTVKQQAAAVPPATH